MQKLKLVIAFLCAFILTGCCCSTACNPADPYENFNRAAFRLNDRLDKAILKPVAIFYKHAVPGIIRCRVTNVFNNVEQIPIVINDLLQFDFCHFGPDLLRFVVNTTFGFGGLFDPASHIGLPRHINDLGLTFQRWGIRHTPYFVIPFFGPSTIGDAIALVPYYYMTVYPYIKPLAVRYSIVGLYWVNYRANLLEAEEVVNEVAVDPYAFQRDAYLQYRRALLEGQNPEIVSDNDIYVEEAPSNVIKPHANRAARVSKRSGSRKHAG